MDWNYERIKGKMLRNFILHFVTKVKFWTSISQVINQQSRVQSSNHVAPPFAGDDQNVHLIPLAPPTLSDLVANGDNKENFNLPSQVEHKNQSSR